MFVVSAVIAICKVYYGSSRWGGLGKRQWTDVLERTQTLKLSASWVDVSMPVPCEGGAQESDGHTGSVCKGFGLFRSLDGPCVHGQRDGDLARPLHGPPPPKPIGPLHC